jgi:hypothetical protein
MREVREIKVSRWFSGGHQAQMAKAVAKVGAIGVLGAGAAVAAGVVTVPFFLPIIGAIATVGVVKGAQNGRAMDHQMIREMALPESEWRRVPELRQAIHSAVKNGDRRFTLTLRQDSSRMSKIQEFLAGGKGYVSANYRVKIKYW